MIRRPPRSTLFPYTTPSDLVRAFVDREVLPHATALEHADEFPEDIVAGMRGLGLRSEEHTSELQSHVNLVCRLLLEKKKIPALPHDLDEDVADMNVEVGAVA